MVLGAVYIVNTVPKNLMLDDAKNISRPLKGEECCAKDFSSTSRVSVVEQDEFSLPGTPGSRNTPYRETPCNLNKLHGVFAFKGDDQNVPASYT